MATIKDGVEHDTKWCNLQNLKKLLTDGLITQTEYSMRRNQLIDELTGTSLTTLAASQYKRRRGSSASDMVQNLPAIIPKPPPDFTDFPAEKSIKYVYDLKTREWTSKEVNLKLDTVPFSRGSLRVVYHMEMEEPGEIEVAGEAKNRYVAKISMNPSDNKNKKVYFRDVETQTIAKYYAEKFNQYHPPKKVDFIKACVLELIQREGNPIVGVEKFIPGPYRKHNSNFGYVSDEERNTPQAFSHFSWEASDHTLLVCDIQGVGDLYTDPQIHHISGEGFGKGNLGMAGISKFLQKHRCNAICRYLKLPQLNAKVSDIGTIPTTRLMALNNIQIVTMVQQAGAQLHSQTAVLPVLKRQVVVDNSKEETRCNRCTVI
uniref:Alpha-type protein kinase domain-containing protein n=1 Tax=Lotharella globosa TaxID=91324 RepID=A0A6V3JKW3_9EUKA